MELPAILTIAIRLRQPLVLCRKNTQRNCERNSTLEDRSSIKYDSNRTPAIIPIRSFRLRPIPILTLPLTHISLWNSSKTIFIKILTTRRSNFFFNRWGGGREHLACGLICKTSLWVALSLSALIHSLRALLDMRLKSTAQARIQDFREPSGTITITYRPSHLRLRQFQHL